MSLFLQLHTLTSYPASLLNRDDVGLAKRIPFGGTVRTRVSSQCLKRHWRTFAGEDGFAGLGVAASVRSRVTFEKFVVGPLIGEGVSEELARAVTSAIVETLFGKSKKAAQKEEVGDDDEPAKDGDEKKDGVRTQQVTVLGRPEVEYLLGVARRVCATEPGIKDVKKALDKELGKQGLSNLEALQLGAGLDATVFGRMVTSDNLARCDAAIHVAHAFTVHAEAVETDYFSAIDEIAREDEVLGSGHINTAELTSGLFYGYVAIDVPLLVSNLTGAKRDAWQKADRTLASGVVERLVKMIATVSPGAKRGATAPHASSLFALAEAGSAQPRTLANAFLEAVRVSDSRPGLGPNTLAALGAHVAGLDRMYGNPAARRLATIWPSDVLPSPLDTVQAMSLPDLATWAGAQIREA